MPLSVLKGGRLGRQGREAESQPVFSVGNVSRVLNVFHHTGGFVWVHLGRKRRGKVIPRGVRAALLQHPLFLNPIAAGGC